ncbi:MAG: virulence factor [Dermatophilaceae bacterium]
MTEYQITFWRDLPSMVTARNRDETAKVQLPQRFQEAIDEAAMRLGDTGSAAYLDGWTRGDWVATDENPTTACDMVLAELEAMWSPAEVAAYLDDLRPAAG